MKAPTAPTDGVAKRRGTILVVDDDDAVLETIVNIVESGGYAAVPARDGAAALALLSERCPDLILCDRTMPVMSGFELLETIRAERPDLDAMPFVFLTALRDDRDVESTALLRPTAYLTKPVRVRYLLETIDALLGIVQRRHDVDGVEIDSATDDADEVELVTVTADTA